MKYTFHSTPGHGYLQVPLTDVKALSMNGKISRCSFRNGSFAFLEEDLDAGLFLQAAESAGWDVRISEESTDDEFPAAMTGVRKWKA